MWIENIKIEGGALDGFDQSLNPGLNVLIGGRGTGKSSVIELIRFGLGAPSSSDAIGKEALEHALGVLGDGKVTITLNGGAERVQISKTASDAHSARPSDVLSPLVFSQKEVEQIGARSHSRLRLVDAFLDRSRIASSRKAPLLSSIKSLSAEIRSLLAEIDDISEKLLVLPQRQEKLAELQKEGAIQSARSAELETLRKHLEELTPSVTAASVRVSSIDRSAKKLTQWINELGILAERDPLIEPWPAQAGPTDQLAGLRSRQQAARNALQEAIKQFRQIDSELNDLRQTSDSEKSAIDNRAREVRQKIEEQQKGASVLDRQISDLSQEIAALNSLSDLRKDRKERIKSLHAKRQDALNEMQAMTQALTVEREHIVAALSKELAPAIRIKVNPLADYREYQGALNAALRGSGLRYRDLADRIVETFSPQEIANLAELREISTISSALMVSDDRAHRLAEGLRSGASIELLITEVGDEIDIELLDGTSFKSTELLSMGQRCTAVLPIILQHTERVIVLDQPEDHLDNAFIVGTLVKAIRSRGASAQTIVATHNPNIPVLGGADLVAHLDSDGERCFVQIAGELDDRAIIHSITTIMEGGREAFERRAAFYSKNTLSDDT
ncbi:AAA family ATPase (plasmid) [Phaeobacter inhibens]|uniref:AAA family ATPase n=1 Tax=Phaeobacter inhibens TaxID=221822 RepID=UPI0021A303B4|nr:AAA family ATPase [Phaeobacter inhibens]UWR86385.1 AAA family ATPase [Phaeobacter inhibens]